MNDFADRRYLLAEARADFLEGASDPHRAGVPEHVMASWQRSVSRGVQPSVVESPYFTELDFESRLVRCAVPVIDQLAEQVADIPMCVALTDGKARLLARKDGSRSFGRVTDRVHFARGFGYAEEMVGTNGVGTVLEYGRSVHIVGPEHFVDCLQSFACAGAPIRDPLTGRIEGVLDISCFADHSTPILHSLVRSAATLIERKLVADRSQAQQALFDLYSRVEARTRDAVLAVGPRMVMSSTRMQTLLGTRDRESLQDHVRYLMSRHSTVDDRIDLPSGMCIRLRASTVSVGNELAGMVGVVTVLTADDGTRAGVPPSRPPRPTPASGPRPRPGAAISASAAWCAAASVVTTALECGDPVMVLGEPGSGRLTLLRDLFERVSNGRVVAIPPAETERAPLDVAARILATAREPVLHVLCDIDRVPGAAVARLVVGLTPGDGDVPTIGATSAEAAVLSRGHQDLLGLFHASVTVPPLRPRGADLTTLTAALLAELAPHRDIRLSRDALRVLTAFGWPGNIRQLRDALAAAITARPVGAIEVSDLPTYCQSVARTALRPVDQMERDVIVSALREARGNRKAAAAALGFARSTLYRKIRQYGITD